MSMASAGAKVSINKIEVLNKLRKGGYVIYMRHPHTDKTTKDIAKHNFADCALQRNLAQKGKEIARQLGKNLRALKIPFSNVKTSQYCRARLVPLLMGMESFEITSNLNHGGNLNPDKAIQQTNMLRKMLADRPKGAANTLLIGHSPNIINVNSSFVSKGFSPADMLVFKPEKNKQGFHFVMRITPSDWDNWNMEAQ